MKEKLKNKIAFITGASRGVGKAIAEALSVYNMKIGLLARSGELLDQVAKNISSAGSQAFILKVDLRDRDALTDAALRFKKEVGAPHFLINNAGIGVRGFWKDISLQSEIDIMEINYIAPLVLIRLFLPNMIDADNGHIININTIGGMYYAPYQGAYCASKAALLAYASSLAFELEKTNVKISSIFPGPIDTDFLDQPNFAGFKDSADKVSPAFIAKNVLSVIDRPREAVFIGSALKLLAVKVSCLYPGFFRKIVEKKNKPPQNIALSSDFTIKNKP